MSGPFKMKGKIYKKFLFHRKILLLASGLNLLVNVSKKAVKYIKPELFTAV